MLKDAEVEFPNIHEKCYFKEDARDYLGKKVCFISRELTFVRALIRNFYHHNDRISSSEDGTLSFKENQKGGDPLLTTHEMSLCGQREFS